MQRATVMLFTLITTGSATVTSNIERLHLPQHPQSLGQGLGVGVRAKNLPGQRSAITFVPAYKFLGRVGQNTGSPVCGQADFRVGYRPLQSGACIGQ